MTYAASERASDGSQFLFSCVFAFGLFCFYGRVVRFLLSTQELVVYSQLLEPEPVLMAWE